MQLWLRLRPRSHALAASEAAAIAASNHPVLTRSHSHSTSVVLTPLIACEYAYEAKRRGEKAALAFWYFAPEGMEGCYRPFACV